MRFSSMNTHSSPVSDCKMDPLMGLTDMALENCD